MPGSTSPKWWDLLTRWCLWRCRVWRDRLGVNRLEEQFALAEDMAAQQRDNVRALWNALAASDGYWKERFGLRTLEQSENRSAAELSEVSYWRDQLGMVALEREMVLFKACLHEGVIAEPARTIIKEWRYQQHMLDQETVRYVTRHGKLPEIMRTMR